MKAGQGSTPIKVTKEPVRNFEDTKKRGQAIVYLVSHTHYNVQESRLKPMELTCREKVL